MNATLTFSLPEDQNSDVLIVYKSPTKDGTYEEDLRTGYNYGAASLEHTDFDPSQWYAIQFTNIGKGTASPLSDPVYGGNVYNSSGFLAISTTSDGAHYATEQDLYSHSRLTPADVEPSIVSNALKQARAIVDYRTAEMDLDRFSVFENNIARRKYNATLRIIKEAEINIALGNIYTALSDDLIIRNMREGGGSAAGGVTIGSTSVQGDSLAERSENIVFLATLAQRYFEIGDDLLASLDTTSVRLVGHDVYIRSPKFKYPFHGWQK